MNQATFVIGKHKIRAIEGPYVDEGKATKDAYEFAGKLIAMLDDMRKFAAKRQLELYNDNWREEEEPKLNESEVCSQLINPSIVLYDEIGAATIYFEDSDMFGGHSIEVSVNEGKISFVTLAG